MARDRGKVEMSNPEVEEEHEIELSLGLSIGRSASYCKPFQQKSREIEWNFDEIDRSFVGSDGGDLLDPQRKREMHALRRQEAKKKREEKQQKKIKNGDIVGPTRIFESSDDKAALESQQLQCRVRDREENANKAFQSEPNRKTRSETVDRIQNPNPNYPVIPMQNQFPQVQYVPFGNGFSFPYVMPCWAPATVSSPEKNVFQPVALRGFRSFHPPSDTSRTVGDGLDHNVVKRIVSTGSLGSTSTSALSDYQSTSQQGGSSSSSSDMRSHSSSAPSEQPQPNVTPDNNKTEHPEHITSHHQIESTQVKEEAIEKLVSNTTPATPEYHHHEQISVNKPISVTENQLPLLPPLIGGDKGCEDKKQRPSTPSRAKMPCVSTTGTGPNGKTITGFLYRYTKTEVSIVCVCHGNSFSPAEFVKHAGGVDVSHPLRHIVVVPSPLG